jgi:hypothetical protein
MELQDILTGLSVISSEISDIKMKKVRGELSPEAAKKKAALVLEEALRDDLIGTAVTEWKSLDADSK